MFENNQGNVQFGNAQNFNQNVEKPINCDEAMGVTSLHELQDVARGQLVRLPDFAEGFPFVARLKRPSMLALAKAGKIPNSLVESANSLFQKGNAGVDVDNPRMLQEMYDVMEIVCESALIQPTLQEVKASGVELTDEQMMAIFSYTQVGVKSLENFRKE